MIGQNDDWCLATRKRGNLVCHRRKGHDGRHAMKLPHGNFTVWHLESTWSDRHPSSITLDAISQAAVRDVLPPPPRPRPKAKGRSQAAKEVFG